MCKIFQSIFFILFLNSINLAQNAKEIAKNCLPSTVSLVMEDDFNQPISLGSGFIIGDGKIVTNFHVIEGAKYGYAFINESTTKHKIQGFFSIDKQNDLVILSVPSITGKPLILDYVKPEVGERIYAIGNPKGLSGTISEGIVSGVRNFEDKELVQITAPISPGSSGGPVINNVGQVVGVAIGTLTSGQNLNFAIPSSLLKPLLEKMNNSVSNLNTLNGKYEPKEEKDELDIREGIVLRDWKYETGVSSSNVEPHNKLIKSVSFRNLLPYTVKNINVLFILYDKNGIPVDYFEEVFFHKYNQRHPGESIKPFLAKTVTFNIFDWNKYRVLRTDVGEYVKVRILDFEIVEE